MLEKSLLGSVKISASLRASGGFEDSGVGGLGV